MSRAIDQQTMTRAPGRDEFPAVHRMVYCFEVLFDAQIDPEIWAHWLASCYITHVEFHSYMPAHELVDTGGNSWNSHAGDPRLWTSRQALRDKIAALHRYGIGAILYASAYAASPAFFSRYPDWAAYWPDGRPVFFPDIMPPYLVIQSLNRAAHAPHTINGVAYNNYREYISAEVTRAVVEYDFDGVRMDFYAMPDTYSSPSFAGTSNMSDDLVDFMAELRVKIRAARPATIITVIELPNVDGDRIRRGVAKNGSVDVHWLELWPQSDQTGPRYSDLIHEIRLTRQLAPEAGIVAAYYPQNPPYEGYPLLPAGWPVPNIQYNYATAFAAGSSWGGQSVGGHGSFTQVLPFKFAYMDDERLQLSHEWNRFMAAYGPYYAWDSTIYRFEQAAEPQVTGGEARALLYSRRDRRDDAQDALVLHLINYGPNTDWAQIAAAPESLKKLHITLPLAAGQQARRVFALDIDGDPFDLDFDQAADLIFTVPQLEYYKLIVVELTAQSTLPAPLPTAPALDDRRPEPFDIGGNLIWGDATRITLLDEEPLFAISNFSNSGDGWVQGRYEWTDREAANGKLSLLVTGGQVKFSATRQEALRFNLNNFPLLSFSWRSASATRLLVTFEIVNMDSGATAELVYAAGEPGAADELSLGAAPDEWMEVRRNLRDDLLRTSWGAGWHNAAVIAMSFGAEGAALFSNIAVRRTPDWVPLHINGVGEEVGAYRAAPPRTRNGTLVEHSLSGTFNLAADLGSSQMVGRVDLGLTAAAPGYQIQVSNDPDFREYEVGATAEEGEVERAHMFEQPLNGRYLRLAFASPYTGAVQIELFTH